MGVTIIIGARLETPTSDITLSRDYLRAGAASLVVTSLLLEYSAKNALGV